MAGPCHGLSGAQGQSYEALKQRGEREDVDEGGSGRMQKVPGRAHAQVMVLRFLEKRWLAGEWEGRTRSTKAQRPERWPL